MYSQCPECLTRFRVPAAALRAAHGTVRCGRCGGAFDAMSRLSDTLEVDGPASTLGEPVSPDVAGAGNTEGATAVGLLSAGEGGGVPEFHFSADDIERVFVDAREWQSRFGTSAAPGDRAGLVGDTSTAELVGFLKAGETGEEAEPERDPNNPTVWVHEHESVEDITLEGERIKIEHVEGFNGFEEDFLEREIEREIEEQHLAEITGSHRGLSASEVEVEAVDSSAPPPALEPLALDLTERSRVLRDVPESAFPPEPADDGRADSTSAVAAASVRSEPAVARAAEPIAPLQRMPAAVAAAAIANESRASVAPPIAKAQPAVAPPIAKAPPAVAPQMAKAQPAVAPQMAKAQPAVAPVAARWRRPPEPEPEDSLEIGDHDHRLADDLADAAAGTPRWAWGIGALALALLLTAQLAHHNRLQLARDATVGPALRGVYSRLGMPLPPNWNLAAFELRQWGANESAPSSTAGAITVRASLKNGAAFAQPMPLLRLELEDRFGGTVARRDFRPAEYLKDPAQAERLLPPGASTEAELEVVGTASEAVGYRLDVCLREEDGVARCAGPAGTSRPSSQAPQ
jgi:predicted Zn finger-like uncharacterized protein